MVRACKQFGGGGGCCLDGTKYTGEVLWKGVVCLAASRDSVLRDFTEGALTTSSGNSFQKGAVRIVNPCWRQRVDGTYRGGRVALCRLDWQILTSLRIEEGQG